MKRTRRNHNARNSSYVHEVGPGENKGNALHFMVVVCLAVFFSIGHRTYLATLNENEKNFSRLSTLERELSFRTELGLYFSYFKTIIEADSLSDGLHQIMRDNVTEYPSTINTLKRFNLYPEVTLGIAYRIYQDVSDYIGHKTKHCWQVSRAKHLGSTQTCEGLGEPSYFYTESVFSLNGLLLGLLFIFGVYLSESLLGGIITVACFIFNHNDCTRVMWAPPLREGFAYPFFVLQMFLVNIIIRRKATSFAYAILVATSQITFMLFWQFAQFALTTQALAVFGVYMLQLIPKATFVIVLAGHTIGLFFSYLLLFGNEMLLTSFFSCSLLALWIIVAMQPMFKNMKNQIMAMLCQVSTFFILLFLFKALMARIFQTQDDAHIAEIFKSKFTDFQNFHTMMYTCAKEFDFIDLQNVWRLVNTLLIPASSFVILFSVLQLYKSEYHKLWDEGHDSRKKNLDQEKEINFNNNAELAYHTLQLLALTVMAVLIMRLKLFWTPQLCLISSLLASRQLFPWGRKEIHYAVVIGILACMAFNGTLQIKYELKIKGKSNYVAQEELVEWIREETPRDAVFAGAMPIMATVKLCTGRPIVNHPHYEDAELRERTKSVYTVYSRKPVGEVKSTLSNMGVQYLILQDTWCRKRPRPGCAMAEVWDLEDNENRGNTPACITLQRHQAPHFKLVYENADFQVLQL